MVAWVCGCYVTEDGLHILCFYHQGRRDARNDALEEAAKVVCGICRSTGWCGLLECKAPAIRALKH